MYIITLFSVYKVMYLRIHVFIWQSIQCNHIGKQLDLIMVLCYVKLHVYIQSSHNKLNLKEKFNTF
jgi:hypothetical protein